jgi:hypothetical protein
LNSSKLEPAQKKALLPASSDPGLENAGMTVFVGVYGMTAFSGCTVMTVFLSVRDDRFFKVYGVIISSSPRPFKSIMAEPLF